MEQTKKIGYDELYVKGENGIKWHLEFYDHPLTGVAEEAGEMKYFTWEWRSDNVYIYKLSKTEKFKLWFSHKLFQWMVGTHTDYAVDKSHTWYKVRAPVWLHNLTFKVFYSKSFVWLRKKLLSVEVPGLDYTEEG